jgi:host factor-I protein
MAISRVQSMRQTGAYEIKYNYSAKNSYCSLIGGLIRRMLSNSAETVVTPARIQEKPANRTKTMATERQPSLQDAFLNHVRKAKTPLTIFLVNGVKLQGIVTWFDNFCVLLRRDGHSQLVYKHAISTIMPGAPVHLMDEDPAEANQG